MTWRLLCFTAVVLGILACKKNVERADTSEMKAHAESRGRDPGERVEADPDNPEEEHLRNIVAVDSSGKSTCALDSTGDVYCWGLIERTGNENGYARPFKIEGMPAARDLRVRHSQFEAIAEDGRLYRWGRDVAPYYEPAPPPAHCKERPSHSCDEPRFELDPKLDPELAARDHPADVVLPKQDGLLRAPQSRSTRRAFFSRITTEGEFLVGRGLLLKQTGEVILPGHGATRLPASSTLVALLPTETNDGNVLNCFVDSTPTVRCVPDAAAGNSAGAEQKTLTLPTAVRSAGSGEMPGGLVALDDGRVAWWRGDLQVEVHPHVQGIVQVDGDPFVACGLDAEEQVHCWQNLPADDPRSRPTPVPEVSGAQAIAVGSHSCALLPDGRVKCWGANSAGQSGVGIKSTRVEKPRYVLAPAEPAEEKRGVG